MRYVSKNHYFTPLVSNQVQKNYILTNIYYRKNPYR